jgi:hypothetical protein
VIAQPISRQIPITVARVPNHQGHVRFVDKVALGQVFSGVFSFPLQIIIPPTVPHSLTVRSSVLQSLDADSVVKQQTQKIKKKNSNRNRDYSRIQTSKVQPKLNTK